MNAVNHDLGLDDGDKSGLLADSSVATKAMGGLIDGIVGGESFLHVNAEGSPPLGEAGALGVVQDALVVEAIEAGTPVLSITSADKRLEASVNLDSGDNTGLVEHVNEGSAIGGVLVEGLLVENGSGDVITEVGGGEQKLTPLDESAQQ